MKLHNETVQIELKNGSVIHGTLISVDMLMNTHLKNVKLTAKTKETTTLDSLSVRGSRARRGWSS